jgi:predicted O-methyltransferase YrrM
MNIERALQTDGWMIESELKWLAQQAAGRKQIAEIGAWKGRSTRALADNTTGIVYVIDTWLGSEEHQQELATHPPDWLLSEFRRNTADLQNIRIFRGTSVEAASTLKTLRFDMIFLDAAHDYENVKADILAWWPLLAPGGILSGHDYGDGCHGVGVKKAVNELIPDVQIGQNEIWFTHRSQG